MKVQNTITNIVAMLVIGVCLWFDKSAWVVVLALVPILNALYKYSPTNEKGE